MKTLSVLDIFSGIGGFSLGLERAGMRTVAFCEIDPYCRAVLKKHWPSVPCYEDIRTLTAKQLAADGIGAIDVICGGYPCQPFSLAGKRMGAADDRHLWPEYFRLVQELRPTWVIGENVVGHIGMGLDNVLSDLEGAGYSTRTFVIPAVAVDAKHRRDRVWIVAHSEKLQRDGSEHDAGISMGVESLPESGNSGWQETMAHSECQRSSTGEERESRGALCNFNGDGKKEERGRVELKSRASSSGETMADTSSIRQQRSWQPGEWCRSEKSGEGQAIDAFSGGFGGQWEPEPGICRVVNGIPNRAHRLKALGNSVVPQVVQRIGMAIIQAENGGVK